MMLEFEKKYFIFHFWLLKTITEIHLELSKKGQGICGARINSVDLVEMSFKSTMGGVSFLNTSITL